MTNKQLYDLVVLASGRLRLLMSPDQYKYVKERLANESSAAEASQA